MRTRPLPADPHLGWTPYLWLLYITFFLVEPAARARAGALTAGYAAVTAAALVVFLVSYFRAFWVRGGELLLVIAVQCGLAAALAPVNAGSSVFFIYAASFAGKLEPSRTAIRAILAVSALGAVTSWVTRAPPWYWVPAVGMSLMVGYVNLHEAQMKRADAKLRLAQEQIEHLAAVAERERIARDLHDLLGHTLSLIVLKSELAARLATRDAERATREIRDVEQVARRALREVREAIRGYRASLADEIRLSRSILGAAGIHAFIDAQPVELARLAEEALALALREAVTNVVRHSGAQACRVELNAEGGGCTLVVEDDGRGTGAPDGSGLRGMRERVAAVGGSVHRAAGPAGRGLRLEIRVPVEPR
ncbi:MAG TPA: sensor histidine kinase [Longimicrobium sp.]|jgi:two-component system sensor histidine kinase DesK